MNRTIDTKVILGAGAIAALFAADVIGASLGPVHLSMAARHALTAIAATSSPLGLVLGGLATFVLAATLVWHRALSKAITPRKDAVVSARRYPSITVIRPVRGKDVGAEDNFRAALDTGYPGDVETLFVFDDDKDPGLPVARDVVAAHRASGRAGTADVIVAGAPPAGMTGKLNAMVVGQRHAHGELIAFGDSDTRPDRDVLRGVVDKLLESPKNGSAFAPVLVHQPPKAAGDVLYAIMQNALYSPLAAWASGEARELPFIMGQLMVFRRSALSAIGGVESVQGQLVDDMAIGKRVYEHGYKNVMSRIPLHIATGGMTLKQFLPVFRRWMSFSRNGLPTSFVWRQWAQGAGFFAAVATLLTAVVTGHFAAALVAVAALVAFSGSLFALQRRYGGAAIPLRFFWTPTAFFLISP
ncbi:MAG TPA: glycosyltransferase, partial [Polyangia bacterium]|nr:glycosyltransferase [Polyangia bacterium]